MKPSLIMITGWAHGAEAMQPCRRIFDRIYRINRIRRTMEYKQMIKASLLSHPVNPV
jgi:hypothetical protein